MKNIIFISLFIISLPTILFSNERRFTYVYETSVLPPNVREIEVWNTYLFERKYFSRELSQRIEYEFGVSNNLMAALYLNYSWKKSDSNGEELGGIESNQSSVSISNECKYKLLDRVADPLGIALYGEWTLGLNEFEVEGKLLLDKQIGKFLFALNGIAEYEWETEFENGETELEKEFKFEFASGIAYMVNPNFAFGIEIMNKNILAEGTISLSTIFAGPTLSYSSKNWWATVTVMPQLSTVKGTSTNSPIETRLLFSFEF